MMCSPKIRERLLTIGVVGGLGSKRHDCVLSKVEAAQCS